LWTATQAACHARGQALSDYRERLIPAIRAAVGEATSLVDVGAGTGEVGAALIGPAGLWIAVEPNAFMARRIAHAMAMRAGPGYILRETWSELAARDRLLGEVVLCAHVPGQCEDVAGCWRATARHARRALCWVVSAEAGPRRHALSTVLPPEGCETPGHALVIAATRALAPAPQVTLIDWTSRYAFADQEEAERFFVEHDPSLAEPRRRRALGRRLFTQGRSAADGFLVAAPRQSAVLTWQFE